MKADDLCTCISSDFQSVLDFLQALKQEVEVEGVVKLDLGFADIPVGDASGVKVLCRPVIFG